MSTTPCDPLKQGMISASYYIKTVIFKGILTCEDERYDTLSLLVTPVTCCAVLNPNVNDSRGFSKSEFFNSQMPIFCKFFFFTSRTFNVYHHSSHKFPIAKYLRQITIVFYELGKQIIPKCWPIEITKIFKVFHVYFCLKILA